MSMTQHDLYIDVIIPLAVRGTYTYRVPPDLGTQLSPGMRVAVQFGKRKIYTAVIRKIHQTKPAGYEVKDIHSILDKEPVVNAFQFKLWEWISSYYMCTLGEVCNAAMPSGLKLESETRIIPLQYTGNGHTPDSTEAQVLDVLKRTKGMSIKKLQKAYHKKDMMLLLKNMMEKGFISIEEKIREKHQPKMSAIVRLAAEWENTDRISELYEKIKKARARTRLLSSYFKLKKTADNQNDGGIEKSALLQHSGISGTVLKAMVKLGIFNVVLIPEPQFISANEGSRKPVRLNQNQQEALSEIKKHFLNSNVVLLHGVTSSGKTEIYIHLIRETISQGKQVLYLLPEIALTAQMIIRLQSVFGSKVAVYHSKYTDRERLETWQNILNEGPDNGQYTPIILGARSALFLPFSRLGLVIVDEEHETTYKQFDPSPRYHARDTAIILAGIHGAMVVLGTATPSIETYYNCKAGKYGLVELHDRYLDMQMPEILVVNTRLARKRKAMHSHFSALLIDHIDKTLLNQEQVMLFQNRRGFSLYLECNECGWVPICKYCDVSLTYHKQKNHVTCHYCGYSRTIPVKCMVCGSEHIVMKGFGTEKIEEEIALLFPKAKVGRLDLDTARSRTSYEKLLDKFDKRELDILVGTQMISKGLDFDHVRVVGIMNADTMLNFPDFRSYERSYQLMAQVSGRAGRKKERGLVIIQTTDDTHPVIDAVIKNDYPALYTSQVQERRKFKYPPFSRLIEIKLKHKDKELLDEAAEKLAKSLKDYFGALVIGPEYPLVGRIQNQFLKSMLIKAEKGKMLPTVKSFIAEEIHSLQKSTAYKSVHIMVDVDPY